MQGDRRVVTWSVPVAPPKGHIVGTGRYALKRGLTEKLGLVPGFLFLRAA